ncbi:MAG: hypothetical protein COT15_01675 [Candidatus Diapherotrites archaeon CG08_land_8_20_14_0_20_34_12]|nr:MAG: hypothetical protein COT15_01675 [Candidatus Diapherotrites archaeon CG08_land_8_20_14_0_20_34_12]
MDLAFVQSPRRGKKSVADWIIFMLSAEWPLSAKSMHQRLVQKYGIDVSYQAVQKYSRMMLGEKVLLRDSFYYKINADWLDSIRKQAIHVKRNYSTYEIKRNGFCKKYIN